MAIHRSTLSSCLVQRVADEARRREWRSRAASLKALVLDAETIQEIDNLATGVFSPLEGFLDSRDFSSVLDRMRLADGTPWAIPIVLDVDRSTADGLREGEDVAVRDREGRDVAILHLREKFTYSRAEYAQKVYGTTDPRHPSVRRIGEMKEVLLAGPVTALERTAAPYPEGRRTPAETRALFAELGWKSVVGFQTRNCPHMAHEAVQKIALAFADGLFIQPIIGKLKAGDFRDEVIIRAYRALIEHYYPKGRVVLGALNTYMRYGGPREAIHHAIMRRNYGCTHFIVGRDHAGVGDFYPPEAAIEIFERFPDLGIAPLAVRGNYRYCRRCMGLVSERTCPHPEEEQVHFSGTIVRETLLARKDPPPEMIRPEVAAILQADPNPFVE
jgi:sulfate adenylyltransferase